MHRRECKVIYLLFAVLSCSCLEAASLPEKKEYAPVVQTEGGKVRGIVQTAAKSLNSERVYLYRGIKYGEAKRFRKPTPAPSWSDVYNATTIRYACPQPNVQNKPENHSFSEDDNRLYSSEDCLFLNVFRPQANALKHRAVMVWIHGGTYISGSSFESSFNATTITVLGDVVVVTLNYRLGGLGFLTGDEDPVYPGNLGLYDIELALRWVQLNVAHFGGDPKNVTIFGESAGAMAASSMVLSPRTKGLFRRAILQSGAANSFIGSQNKTSSRLKFQALAALLSCQNNAHLNATEAIRCLEGKDVVELQNSVNNMSRLNQFFVPTYETEFLPETPVKLLKHGSFNNQTDLLFGVNRDEGANGIYKNLPELRSDSKKPITLQMVKKAILLMMRVFGLPHQAEEVFLWYTRGFTNETSQEKLRNAVANVYGDYNLVCPTMLFGQQFAKMAPANRYYSYRLVQPLSNGTSWCPHWMGVCHAVDVEYVFGVPIDKFSSGKYSQKDYQLSVDMITSWTNFAKTGNPGMMGSVKWEGAYEKGNEGLKSHQMMVLDVDHYQNLQGYFKDPCDDFWRSRIFV